MFQPNARQSSSKENSQTIVNEDDVIEWPKEKKQVTYMLECPVCTDFMTGVVRMCSNGHSMCNSCFLQILKYNGKCPLCRKYLSKCGARNYFLENFAAACTFKCKFSHQGCPMSMEGHEFYDHINNCPFRDYSCRIFNLGHNGRSSSSACSNSNYSFDKFVEHLTDFHSIPVIENGSILHRKLTVHNEKITPSLVLIKYDSKFFFSYVVSHPKGPFEVPTVHSYQLNRWILKAPEKQDLTCIGSTTAVAYSYNITTSFDKSLALPREKRSLYLQLTMPSHRSPRTNFRPFVQREEKAGTPLLFSAFPRRGNAKFSQEDDNSLFGLYLARGVRDAEPTEFSWHEIITISKAKSKSI